MKYISPKYDYMVIEAQDILLAFSDGYEIEENGDGIGSVMIDASNVFN